jgi:hypothetical protein
LNFNQSGDRPDLRDPSLFETIPSSRRGERQPRPPGAPNARSPARPSSAGHWRGVALRTSIRSRLKSAAPAGRRRRGTPAARLASAEHIESGHAPLTQHTLTCGQLVRPHQPNNEQGAQECQHWNSRGLEQQKHSAKDRTQQKDGRAHDCPLERAVTRRASVLEAPPGERRKGCLVPRERERPRYRPRNQGLPRPWGQGGA